MIKKIAPIALILAISIGGLGCGSNSQNEPETDKTVLEKEPIQANLDGGKFAGGDQMLNENIDFGDAGLNSLWSKANENAQKNKVWAPEGNNAVELYLQISQNYTPKNDPDNDGARIAVKNVLEDIKPYLSIAIDKAIEKKDANEASRLIRLLAAIDSTSPSLQRQMLTVRKMTGNLSLPKNSTTETRN